MQPPTPEPPRAPRPPPDGGAAAGPRGPDLGRGPGPRRRVVAGCAVLLVVAIGAPLGLGAWWVHARRVAAEAAEAAQSEAAADAFGGVFEAFEEADRGRPTYDIDKTIRVIHEIDQAMREQDDLDAYLAKLAVQDYRDVAPEVLAARKRILDILLRIYATQVALDDQQAMWEVTSELLLSTLSVVQVSGDANLSAPSGSLSVDRAQAQRLYGDLKQRQARHERLVTELDAAEADLFEALFAYSEVYHRYRDEWDQLATLRDRAYLAAYNQDWAAARASAELAVERAPHEREARLLAALATIEQGDPEEREGVARQLEAYVEEHPDSSAPAFLLLGVLAQRAGDDKAALLAFQQSAAYYPKQSERLTDMLDPYRVRSYLRASREGSFIVELYQSTMLGAGYFSPDLQMARTLFEKGEDEAGRAKVLDHFARRRAQKQWDFVVSDIAFCHEMLGPEFWRIFPEDTYLDLMVSPAMLSDRIALSVNNRSAVTVHNATLILAVHFTDTYPEDYEAIVVEPSVPAVLAHETTDFGSVEISVRVNGVEKRSADVVHHRAVLVTDEAVVWVDTDAFRIAEHEAFRNRQRTDQVDGSAPSRHPAVERHPEFQDTVHTLVNRVAQGASLEVEARYGADSVLVELPRELAILRPLFRLRHGEEVFAATDNVIEGDRIALRFAGVHNFDEGAGGDLVLDVASPFGDVVLTWTPGDDLRWRFVGVEPRK